VCHAGVLCFDHQITNPLFWFVTFDQHMGFDMFGRTLGRVTQLPHVRQVGLEADLLFQLHRFDRNPACCVNVGQMGHQAKPDARTHKRQGRWGGVVTNWRLFIAVQPHARETGDVDLHNAGLALFFGGLGCHHNLELQRLGWLGPLERFGLKLGGLWQLGAQFTYVEKFVVCHVISFLRTYADLPAPEHGSDDTKSRIRHSTVVETN